MDGFTLDGRHFFVKRDDLTDPRYSGNKLRKLTTLLSTPPKRYTTVVSHGGIQSNAMLSIAHLASAKGWDFHYYCKTIPPWLKANPSGNFEAALQLGMSVHEVAPSQYRSTVESVERLCGGDALFIPQGGADPVAEAGIRILAEEILSWYEEAGLETLTVATPSGTGTTALYLRKHLPENIEVLTTPVVGDEEYLTAQWRRLEPDAERLPTILHETGKWAFAKPQKRFYEIWQRMREAGIEFDLIYAPKMWLEIMTAYETLEKPLLYIHSGGVSGNVSQLENYRFRGLLDA